MTLNDLIKEAQAIACQLSSGDIPLNQEIHLNLISDEEENYSVDVCMEQEPSAHENDFASKLPASMDEAAREYTKKTTNDLIFDNTYSDYVLDAFKAGAEWMAGQGEAYETEIRNPYENAFADSVRFDLLENSQFKEGDKVIVQIRKK